MNPIRIVLRDFASYASEDISLSDVHVAVLLGDNGSGKTTLIEAIPWALYGQGSKGGKRGAINYVRRGAESCSVSLYFEQGGTTYVVQREYFVDRSRTALALLVLDTGSGEIEDISHKNLTDTQSMIESIIGMDYNAFVASVFALQGQSASLASDALTDQERKEILSSILGLAMWDEVLNKAREQLRDVQNHQSSLTGSVDVLEKQALNLDSLQEDYNAHLVIISNLKEEVEGKQDTRDKIATEHSFARARVEELNVARLAKEISDLEVSLQSIETSIAQTQADERQKVAALEQTILQLQTAMENNLIKLEQMGTVALDNNIEEELDMVVQCLDSLNAQQAERTELQKQVLIAERRAAQAAKSRERNVANLTAQLKRAKQDAALLSEVPCSKDMHTKCQLLQQAVSAAETLGDLQEQIDTITSKIAPEEIEAKKLAQKLEQYPDISEELAIFSTRQKELTEMIRLSADISKLESAVKSDEREIAQLENQIVSTRSNTEITVEQLLERYEIAETELTGATDKLESVGEAVSAADNLTKCLHEAESVLKDSRAQLSEATTRIGGLQRALDDALAAQKTLGELQGQLEQSTHKLSILELIECAANKKSGVPALIIENALPAIEHIANQTLSEMNDGRFEVRFETQLMTKSGTQQDVLRLYIYDGPEPRPYATYSGAERFMVDLAVRIAIAKYLSELSGSDVRMLVLDEGLSVLDSANRLEATQALLAVAKSFDKLLVVTHIAELQDMFERRIVIEKTASGSRAHIQ